MHGAFLSASFSAIILQQSSTKQKRKSSDSSELDLLWRDYFRDPFHLRASPSSKKYQRVEHKYTQDLLRLNGENLFSVQVERSKAQLQPKETDHGEVLVEKERRITNVEAVWFKEQEQEDHDFIVHESNQQNIHDPFAFVASLKACSKEKNLLSGIKIHTDILKTGLLKNNVFVGSALVNMYTKCGALEIAQEVFDELPIHNVVLWNTIISGYAQEGHDEKVLACFEQMVCEGFSPDTITFVSVLKACGSLGAAKKGHDLHTWIVEGGLLEEDEDSTLANEIIDMYVKCGLLGKAREFFDNLSFRNVVSWSMLIAGYMQHGQSEEALNCHEQMKLAGFFPSGVTFVCILKACGIMGRKGKGQELHAEIIRDGTLEHDIHIGTALIDMYAACAAVAEAQDVFDEFCVRNIDLWTPLIVGYARQGHGERALDCFDQAQHEGSSCTSAMLVWSLKACGSIGASGKGQELHSKIVKEGSYENDTVVGTALVDMYANCGMVVEAKGVFNKLLVRDVVSWTALMGGYARYGQCKEAFECFEQMQREGVSPNTVSWNALIAGQVQYGDSKEAYKHFQQMQLEGLSPDSLTFACILKSCRSRGTGEDSLEKLHSEIIRKGVREEDLIIANTLIDVYAKNGRLAEARAVFDKLPTRDVVSWNALMSGYASLAKDTCIFSIFDQMVSEGQEPDLVTFTIMLNACSHRGFLDMGQMYFENIHNGYGKVPTLEHHSCMVDLFGRAGRIDKALALIEEMPFSTDIAIWHTLLSACGKLGNLNLGRWAFDQAARLDETDAAAYVCISNACAAAVRQQAMM